MTLDAVGDCQRFESHLQHLTIDRARPWSRTRIRAVIVEYRAFYPRGRRTEDVRRDLRVESAITGLCPQSRRSQRAVDEDVFGLSHAISHSVDYSLPE